MEFGDLQQSMRYLMQRGMNTEDGNYISGLRDLLRHLKDQRNQQLERYDMNSVMEASDFIHFVHQGQIAWHGPTSEILTAKSEALNEFIFASKIMRELRKTVS